MSDSYTGEPPDVADISAPASATPKEAGAIAQGAGPATPVTFPPIPRKATATSAAATVTADPLIIVDLGSFQTAFYDLARRTSVMPFWRGQGDAAWFFRPSAFRDRGDGRRSRNELGLIGAFRGYAATRHSNCPPRDDFLQWLLLAQHYGLPTRLLDWSFSPLVALFFAVANKAHDDKDGTLWALDSHRLNGSTMKAPFLQDVDSFNVKAISAQAFGVTPALSVPKAIALAFHEIDQRMLLQQAAFTIHSSVDALTDLPNSETFVFRASIPSRAKVGLRMLLAGLGISRRTLFPDLSNLADFLESTM